MTFLWSCPLFLYNEPYHSLIFRWVSARMCASLFIKLLASFTQTSNLWKRPLWVTETNGNNLVNRRTRETCRKPEKKYSIVKWLRLRKSKTLTMVIIHYVEFTLKPTKPVSFEGNRGHKSTLCSVIVIKYQDASWILGKTIFILTWEMTVTINFSHNGV